MGGLLGVIVFPIRLHRSDLQAGVSAGFVGSHAVTGILFTMRRHMRFNLFPEPFVAAVPGRQVEKACE
jgi:hypothetical protein